MYVFKKLYYDVYKCYNTYYDDYIENSKESCMTEQEIVRNILEKKGSISNVMFVACGGSIAAFYVSKFFLESESKNLNRVGYYSSNEFVHATPKSLQKTSLVIACSHQGNTPETVEAIKKAKSMGATTVAFTYVKGSEITKFGDYEIVYDWGPNSSVEDQKMSKGLKLSMEILHQTEHWDGYEAAMDGWAKINGVVSSALASSKPAAQDFAKNHALEKLIYVVGSGASFGSVYIEDICILKEMQWIHSASIHSGEFFHGPLEITDTETSFLLFIGDGRTRELDERVLRFLNRYGRKTTILDVRNLGISVINDAVVEYYCPLVFTNVVAQYNEQLAEVRKHPLATRRYMWKVSY